MASPARPIYLKLRDLIAEAILNGTYPEGSALPSVRALASEQGANPLTVAKAYQQFQQDDLIRVQRGVGMFVAPGAVARLREMERRAFLAEEWPEVRSRMLLLGLSPEDLISQR